MFCGRYDEFVGTEHALFQTKNGNPHHFLIHGERGIGKSSLLYSLQLVASGYVKPFEDENRFKFIALSLELEPGTTYADLIGKIGAELQRAVAGRQPATEFAKNAWDFLKRWEVMGVKYTDTQRQGNPNDLLDELTFTFEDVGRLVGLVDEYRYAVDLGAEALDGFQWPKSSTTGPVEQSFGKI